jgi:hypothetical protein
MKIFGTILITELTQPSDQNNSNRRTTQAEEASVGSLTLSAVHIYTFKNLLQIDL